MIFFVVIIGFSLVLYNKFLIRFKIICCIVYFYFILFYVWFVCVNWIVLSFEKIGKWCNFVFILCYGKLWKIGEIEIFNEIIYFIEVVLIIFFYIIDIVFEII